MDTNQKIFNERYIYKLNNTIPFFIAEIGLNHNGNLNEAIALVEAAARSGADAVKFQIFNADTFYSVYAKSLLDTTAPHYDDSMIQFFKKYELLPDEYTTLARVAQDNGVIFFASCFDEDSFSMMEKLQVPLYKIASSEITNLPLLQKIASTGKHVIMSTGISYEHEIAHAVTLLQNGSCQVALLHCISLYPVPADSLNLLRIRSLQTLFNLPVGFSDHCKDNRASMMAAALGARIFEKHFKLSSDHECVDKDVSLFPEEFARYVEDIHLACQMLGDGAIDYHENEAEVARSARRSLYAARDIPAGTILQYSDIVVKRPGVGLSPLLIEKIVGKKLKRTINKDMPLREEDIK